MKPTQQQKQVRSTPPVKETQVVKRSDIQKLTTIENRGALVTTNIPAYLKQEGVPLGAEHMRPSDIALARFQLAQDGTRAAKKQNTERYINGLEPGMFYNTMTKQVYGTEVFFIPLLEWPKRARMPEEFTGSGGPLCRSENGKIGEGDPGGVCRTCVYSKWVDNAPPLCSEVMAYHILPLPERDYIPTPEDWCVWGARKSAINAGKLLNRFYKMRGPVDLFKCVFKINSFWDTKQTQPCWVPKVENAEWVTQDQYAFAREFFHSVNNLELAGSIHVSDIVDEEAIDLEPTRTDEKSDFPYGKNAEN